ncbi:MAG TPA: site-specific DNA-methyltransferase [Candidatus Hydrogenedentes bacterium]|nr:site-specific DNA-methyltransferase [Candidatus Hydrogenedentota bacterium]HPG65688.1 site-specific DNA-methyltransferase [Candidatus Hydrogenedentota bacterium]
MARKRGTKAKATKNVETLKHGEATRKNIPTAEYQSVMRKEDQDPIRIALERRNRDLDPQLVWRGKDEQDWSDLVIQAPPLYIQEKVHPKVLIDDLMRQTKQRNEEGVPQQIDFFADFNGFPEDADKTDYYKWDGNWSNRMILGDSLQVMASLAEREGLRGQVQCIYLDPPYGIKFNSNFQWSTTSRDVKDGNVEHLTREPEQVKAFRDTWRDGIHSYLTYLRDRLTIARDLLTESGSVFVQIGDENVHRVRALTDEVFGEENCVAQIVFTKTTGSTADTIAAVFDTLLWYAKSSDNLKVRKLYEPQTPGEEGAKEYKRVEHLDTSLVPISQFMTGRKLDLPPGSRVFVTDSIVSKGGDDPDIEFPSSEGMIRLSCRPNRHWKPGLEGIRKLWKVGRLLHQSGLRIYKRYFDDFPYRSLTNIWSDTRGEDDPQYVVQTDTKPLERCLLMTTDPGDLVLDPTCGSGTTAYVAEQWGRRWITIDTSRVALALARARIMGARYPYYLLADSKPGQEKEAEVTRTAPSEQPTYGNIRQGFVYERVPHITLKSIANNAEIDVIWEKFQEKLEPLRRKLNEALATNWEEWEIPRELPRINTNTHESKSTKFKKEEELAIRVDSCPSVVDLHRQWWELRIARQKEIDASIAAKADYEYLYDKPYEDKKTVRVAGPFTVESLSPHRVLGVDEDDELIDHMAEASGEYGKPQDFATMILENLRTAGVQQAHKADRIAFTSLMPWPGEYVCAEGRYFQGGEEKGAMKRAGILIGPEFGTVSRADLVAAAREAGDADFDVLIACAFNYDARSCDFDKLGRVPVLKARMNADLHMADDLKNTGKGNLFVIFGEPDIEVIDAEDGQVQVKVKGVDVFHPQTGEVRSDGAEGIACWFIDTDYNEESFFVRHAYFLGQNDPYKALKTTLKAEINEEAWESLHSDTSRPFDKPASGRIAVKVINHLGDEVMKVFRVS